MIDTDKYEGHTPAPWKVNNPDDEKSLIFSVGALKFVSSANTRLIADAPLLLAEVIRLREGIEVISKNTEQSYTKYNKNVSIQSIVGALKGLIE